MSMRYAKFRKSVLFKIFIFSLFLLSVNVLAELSLSIYPTPIVAGEESSLIINSSEGKAEIKDLPKVKGLQWLKPDYYAKDIMVINGVKYIKTSYPFIAKRPGRIKLPSMKISIEDRKDITTAEKEILVSTGPLSDLASLLFLKCDYPGNVRSYYVGEDIPLKIDVYRAIELKADPVEYPQIKMNNIIFDSFKNNKQNDKYAPYPYGSPLKISKDGIDYIKTTFYTSFRALTDGDLKGGISVTFNIQLKGNNKSRGNSPFEDDFFGSSFFSGSFFNQNKVVTRIITADIPEIKVRTLPPVPGNGTYLGLIGDWEIKESIKYEKLKEGEPITISLELTGFGSTENLDVPEINVPGFNTYSPEIINKDNGYGKKQDVKIDYVLIPTEPGKTNLNLSFLIFDTKAGKYKTVKVKKTLDIQKGDGESVKSFYTSTASEKRVNKKSKVSNSILYIKVNPGASVELPLYKNFLFVILFLFISGPVVWILFELFYFRKKYITGKDGFKRKSKAARKKGYILKSVKKAKDLKELSDAVQKDVIPYINDMKGFPPGTTAEGLENILNKDEITKPLKACEASAYIPSNEDNSDELKKKIIKIVKHFSMFTIVCVVMFMSSYNTYGADNSKAKTAAEFTKFYNNGKFDKALEICKERTNLSSPNPDWIYNLGNCYFQKGDLAKAMVCYERALRLSPRNSDVLENLNFVRRKLFLPDVYQTSTPVELIKFIRDYLRPDEWLLIFFIGWFMIFTSLIIRRLRFTNIWLILCITAVTVCVLSATAYLTEQSSHYNSSNAIVVERNVKVYSLPTKDSPDAGFILNSGEQVRIQENVQNWIRVRKDKSEGWIIKNKAEQIWPYYSSNV